MPTRTRASANLKRASGIRWDRLSRVGLLFMLVVIVGLYMSPAKHWWEQSGTARAQKQELDDLQAENTRLKSRAKALRDPDMLEREARKLGMVKKGERAYVIQAPRDE